MNCTIAESFGGSTDTSNLRMGPPSQCKLLPQSLFYEEALLRILFLGLESILRRSLSARHSIPFFGVKFPSRPTLPLCPNRNSLSELRSLGILA